MDIGAIVVFAIGLFLMVIVGAMAARSEHPVAGIFVVILIFFLTGFLFVTMNAHHATTTSSYSTANAQHK